MTIFDCFRIFFGRHSYGLHPEEETVLAWWWFAMGVVFSLLVFAMFNSLFGG